ncbi:hypothetical protein [Virgisporangium aurantiacum]|uniref:Uncharacterized protein n=1 Tax=Virgisporangium aurantiacum TaxID=175570 RepID=A0A8J4E049_9ACTN|nr:hypothetical protein [Virgisporangium aurantiacum]GIJ57370.1 hypothetical protein Vau01_048860 [Virgisporangium aurantiacum]
MEPVAAGRTDRAGITGTALPTRPESLREIDRERARRIRSRILGNSNTLVSLFQSSI